MAATGTNPIGANVGPFPATEPIPVSKHPEPPPPPVPVGKHPGATGDPIPTFIIGGDSGSLPSSSSLNQVAQTMRDQQLQVIAENAPLRIPYGRVIMGSQIADVLIYGSSLVVLAIWGEGPINQIEQLYLDDKVPAAGVTVTNYTGSQVAADPTLVAAYAAQSPAIAYSDVLANIAYSVVVIPPSTTTGFPRVSAVVQGVLVWDPRAGGGAGATVYSDNPALALADLHVNARYGAAGTVDWTSVTAVANACDALVAGAEKRRAVGLVIEQPQAIEQWYEALRAYAGCFVARTGAALSLVADRPASSSFTFSETTGNCRVKNLTRRSRRDVPTVVAIRYTDTANVPWRDAVAYAYADGVLTGSTPWKPAEVAMPGVTRPTQANREAIERLNKLTLLDLICDVEAQDEALAVTMGDVVTLTANIGLANQLVRVVTPKTPMLGRPVFSVEAYNAAVYSDSVSTGAPVVDTKLPNPNAIPAATALVITETVYLEQTGGNPLAGGLIYQSRFDVAWTAPAGYPYPIVYRVEVRDGVTGTKIRDELTSSTGYSTPSVQQGKLYTINVFARSPTGVESPVLTGTKTALGKTTPPSAIPSATFFEIGGVVILIWTAATDVDVLRYEWRYTPGQTVGGSWATATLIDRIDGLRATFRGFPLGTHRFYGRAVDSVGNYSSSDVTLDITTTSDVNSFVQSRTFTSPTLTNMAAIPALEGAWVPRWMTNVAADQWNSVEPNAFNSGANPVASYHANATQTWQGESWDLGNVISANWTLVFTVTVLSGTVNFYMETSPDGSTWTRQSGANWSGATRFIRPVAEALTSSTFRVDGPPTIGLAALMKPESGVVTTSASVATLVQLANNYFNSVDVQATPINITTARAATVDRLLIHPQTGLMVQYTGNSAYSSGLVYQLSTTARTVLADDYLEYDVFIDPASPAAASFGYLSVPAANANVPASLPDSANNSITGDIEVQIDFNQADYATTTGGAQALARKWGTAGQNSWQLVNLDGGTLRWLSSSDGTAISTSQSCSATLGSAGLSAGTRFIVKVTHLMNDGAGHNVVKFWYSTDGGTNWTQLGATVTNTGTTSIKDGTLAVNVGDTAFPSHGGLKVYRFKMLAGIGGTLKQDFNPSTGTQGAGTLADGVNGTWTIGADSTLTIAAGNGGMDVITAGGSLAAVNDADGYNAKSPGIAFDALARGIWKSRKIALATLAGGSTTSWRLINQNPTQGLYKTLYRNIRVTNGSGTLRLQVWSSGDVANPSTIDGTSQTGIGVGPANSFNLYAFTTSTGAQVASDVRWSFKGY